MSNEPETPVVQETRAPETPVTILGDTTDKVVTMSQSKLDELIRSRMGAAGRQAREDAEKLRIENERLKEVVSGKGSEEELQRTKGLLAEERLKNQAVLDESIKRQRDLVISQEGAANNHVDLDTTLKLTRQNLRHDPATGGFTVLDDAGNPRLNANSDPMTVSEFFKDFSSKKLHLVRGQVLPGAGGQSSHASAVRDTSLKPEQIFGAKSDARLANQVALRDKGLYDRLKIQARQKGLIA